MNYFDGFNPKFIESAETLLNRVLDSLASTEEEKKELLAVLDEHAYEIADNFLRDLNYDCKMVGFKLICFLAAILTKILMPLNENNENEAGAFRWVMDAISQLKYEATLEMSAQAEVLAKQTKIDGGDVI
jgi:hypothetical protein